jgi:hypothetical protein
MTFISFVSEDYLKSFTPISKNIDINELLPFLEEVELINTREILGKPLYDDLKTKFIDQTLSTDEVVLVTYIKKSIAFRCGEAAIPFLNMKIGAKGPQKLSGDYSQPSSLSEMKYLRDELKNYSEYHETRAVEYLCKNSNLFPLFGDADDESGIVATSESRYDADIYFDSNEDIRINKYLYGKNNPL